MTPKIMSKITLALFIAVLAPFGQTALAQSEKPGVEKLYIMNCGEGVAGDIGRWSPGVNEGQSMDFVDISSSTSRAGSCGTPAFPTRSPRCQTGLRLPIQRP